MFNEEDQDKEDQVAPQMPLETPLSPMNHHATYQMRKEGPNMPDHHTPILFLRNPLTLDMLQSTQKKYQVRVPQAVRKASITIRHYNSQSPQIYVAIIIPTLKGENITKLDSNVNLEVSLAPGGSSNSQEGITMKMLLWNCRGAHNSNFMNNMRALIEWNNPTILSLTETRMEDHDNLLQALDFTDVIQIPAIGYLGGITILEELGGHNRTICANRIGDSHHYRGKHDFS
ncbi:hypothetical protein KY290_001444 [Solanum tuberosum]|uniref:Endonuclease/exonuclease/phosphatase n=2 Tax=Solanum tuberosum TaxID=4113 RepID=A0ABQ7WNK1_SOLTU|nr:hypothetical protein KY290_001444 [Solanum tuberosum]